MTPAAFLGAREAPTPLELHDYLEPDRLRAVLRARGRVRRAARGELGRRASARAS